MRKCKINKNPRNKGGALQRALHPFSLQVIRAVWTWFLNLKIFPPTPPATAIIQSDTQAPIPARRRTRVSHPGPGSRRKGDRRAAMGTWRSPGAGRRVPVAGCRSPGAGRWVPVVSPGELSERAEAARSERKRASASASFGLLRLGRKVVPGHAGTRAPKKKRRKIDVRMKSQRKSRKINEKDVEMFARVSLDTRHPAPANRTVDTRHPATGDLVHVRGAPKHPQRVR